MIPINIYIIGNFLGAALQTPLFRFQITGYGSSIPYNAGFILYYFRNLQRQDCVVDIFLGHRSVSVSTILFLFPEAGTSYKVKKRSGTLIVIAGIYSSVLIIVQYGPLFHGPAGTAIPIGLPVLFVIGGWMYMEGQKEEAGDEEEEVQEIGEGSE